MREKVIAVSGGFDPLHVGHLRMFEEAKEYGDKLVVILNNDAWLRAKKGYAFMPEEQRARIIRALKEVDEVVITGHKENDPDRSVCSELAKIRPHVFANGGDRKQENVPEVTACKDLGIRMLFNIGGEKVESSSDLVSRALLAMGNKAVLTHERPWGSYTLFAEGANYWVKSITLKAGARTSLQRHVDRGELWMCVDGDIHAVLGKRSKDMNLFDAVRFAAGTIHRLSSIHGGTILEIGYGKCDEEDIERIEDDYGR